MTDRSVVEAGRRWWVILVLRRPRGDAAVHDLLHALRELGARPMSADVLLAPDDDGLEARLQSLADRAAENGGRVMLADSVILDDREPGGTHAQ